MTTVTGTLLVGGGVPAAIVRMSVASQAIIGVSGGLLLPERKPITVAVDGTWTVECLALPDGYAYEFRISIGGGSLIYTRTVVVPASGSVRLQDLADAVAPTAPYMAPPVWATDAIAAGATATTKAAEASASATAAAGSATAANNAKVAAEAVPTTTDGLMQGIDGNAGSAFRVQQDARQSATIAEAAGTHVSSDFTRAPDGPVTTFDSGQPVLNTYSSAPGAALAVAGGVLTNTSTAAGVAAGYYESNLTANVGRIGTEFRWAAGGTTAGGRMVLACFSPSINSMYPVIPGAACHFLVSRTGWTYGIWVPGDGAATVLASGTFAAALRDDGTIYQMEIAFAGNTATLYLPDGARAVVTDPRISTLMGVAACWEVFLANAVSDSRPGMTAVWADSTTAPFRRGAAVKLRDIQTVARETARQSVASQAAKSIFYGPSSPGVTVATPTSSGAVDAVNLYIAAAIVPDSGFILVEQEASLVMTVATSVFWSVTVGGAGGSGSSSVAVVDNAQFTGRARALHRMGPFTPGATITALWKHQALVAPAASLFSRGDNGHGAILKISATT